MFENLGALTEADKKSTYSSAKNGQYVFTVKEVEKGTTDEKEFINGAYVPTGNKIPQITLKLAIMTLDGQSQIERTDKSVGECTYTAWINAGNLGWNKKDQKPREGRAIIAGLLGLDDAAGDLSPFSAFTEDQLIGKQFKGYLRNFKNKAGKDRTEVIDIEPKK